MAIIIHAKNIYGDVNNDKVYDNQITKVNYQETIVKSLGVLTTREIPFTLYTSSDNMTFNTDPNDDATPIGYSTINPRNPSVSNTYNISSISVGNKTYTSSTSPTRFPVVQYYIDVQGEILDLPNEFDMTGNYNCVVSYTGSFPHRDTIVTSSSVTTTVTPVEINVTSEVCPINIYNTYSDFTTSLGTIPFITENKPYIKIGLIRENSSPTQSGNLKFAIRLEYDREINGIDNGETYDVYTKRMFLKTFSFTPKSQQFEINESTVSVGDGTHNFVLNSNELFQPTSTITKGSTTQKISNYLANSILDKWTNGKETATLLVEYGEYYNDDSPTTLAKSITTANTPMQFYIGDVVQPYISCVTLSGGTYIADEKPLSRKTNGDPKDFLVVGVNPIYDGACWQQLTLLEN